MGSLASLVTVLRGIPRQPPFLFKYFISVGRTLTIILSSLARVDGTFNRPEVVTASSNQARTRFSRAVSFQNRKLYSLSDHTIMSFMDIVSKFNQQADSHSKSQSLNPFSEKFEQSRSPSPRFSREEYGKWVPTLLPILFNIVVEITVRVIITPHRYYRIQNLTVSYRYYNIIQINDKKNLIPNLH